MVRFRHLALIFLFLSLAVAGEEVPLKGSAFLGDEDCAGGLKSDSCILSFQLTGKAAKLLFEGLRVKAVQEECTGGMDTGPHSVRLRNYEQLVADGGVAPAKNQRCCVSPAKFSGKPSKA